EHHTPEHRHQLALTLRMLVVKPAQHTPTRIRQVVLHKLLRYAQRPVAPRVPALHEIPPLVCVDVRLDHHHTRKLRLDTPHSTPPASSDSTGWRSRPSRY